MKIDALIPIKGESERVENKNFRILGDKPLYKHILDTLKRCNNIENIYITTDVPNKIQHDKIIVLEPQRNMNEVISGVIDKIEGDAIFQTHATNPFLKSETIDKIIENFNKYKYKPMFGVSEYRQRFWNVYNEPINHDPTNLIRTQDLTPLFMDNSTFYLFQKNWFMRHGRRMDETSIPYPISREEALDIDTEIDWRIAECLAKRL